MNKVFIFTLGAAVGSLLTWKLLEEKYKQIADEEIQSVIDRFKERERMVSGLTTSREDSNEPKVEYKEIVNDLGYSNEDEEETDDIYEVFIEPGVEYIKPHIIEPEEYGDTGYDVKTLYYYADSILADEGDEIITDAEDIIGDGLAHFGEYSDDSVYVRNDNTECDYEILKHEKTFTEINGG